MFQQLKEDNWAMCLTAVLSAHVSSYKMTQERQNSLKMLRMTQNLSELLFSDIMSYLFRDVFIILYTEPTFRL